MEINTEKHNNQNYDSYLGETPNLKLGDIDHRQWDAPIKKQINCYSHWAFATIAAIENRYHRLTGKLTIFSEQYLINCDNADRGCKGGWPDNTFEWIKNNGLIRSEFLKYVRKMEFAIPH